MTTAKASGTGEDTNETSAAAPLSLSVSLGVTEYFIGDTFDFASLGTTVLVSYADGSAEDVTDAVVWTPPDGSEVSEGDEGNLLVTAAYTDENGYAVSGYDAVQVQAVVPSYLTLTLAPAYYKAGDTLDYTGSAVLCTFTDGSKADVTAEVVWKPEAGKTLTEKTQEVTAVYAGDWGSVRASAALHVTAASAGDTAAKLIANGDISSEDEAEDFIENLLSYAIPQENLDLVSIHGPVDSIVSSELDYSGSGDTVKTTIAVYWAQFYRPTALNIAQPALVLWADEAFSASNLGNHYKSGGYTLGGKYVYICYDSSYAADESLGFALPEAYGSITGADDAVKTKILYICWQLMYGSFYTYLYE